MSRRYATYAPVPFGQGTGRSGLEEPITDVGGYDDLLDALERRGVDIDMSRAGLAELDAVLDALPRGLERAVGMYFGDVVIRCLPGSRWKVVREGRPCVEVAGGASADVIAVAESRLAGGPHTLIEVLDHLEGVVGRDG